jgi:hypothetical protein
MESRHYAVRLRILAGMSFDCLQQIGSPSIVQEGLGRELRMEYKLDGR